MRRRSVAATALDSSTRDGADAAARWRRLATLLLLLLGESRTAQRAAEARHSAEQAAQRASFARDLEQDRETFLDLVAHELKTPLAVIKAYAEILEAQAEALPASDTARQVVGHLLEQAEVMAALIEQVLDVQRLRRGRLPLEISRVDLLELAREVAEAVQHTTRQHVLRVVADRPPGVVRADRLRLRQVLVNLIENAVKYSAGGEVVVEVRGEERDGRPWAALAVRDQGVGIEAADLGRIFNRFEQVSSAPVRGHVGLGLGLYVARQIARAHGGEVAASSPGRGRGSTFTLLLPLDADPVA